MENVIKGLFDSTDELLITEIGKACGMLKHFRTCEHRNIATKEDLRLCELFLTPVIELSLSARLSNIFKAHGIKTLGDVARLSHYDLYVKRHWGPKSRGEVEKLLKKYNLHLSYDVDGLLEKCRYKIK